MVSEVIKKAIAEAIKENFSGISDLNEESFAVDIPKDISHGDFSTAAALTLKDKLGKSSKEIADVLLISLQKNKNLKD